MNEIEEELNRVANKIADLGLVSCPLCGCTPLLLKKDIKRGLERQEKQIRQEIADNQE
jgi:hypothetical protein